MKTKNILLIFTLICFLYLQSCENTNDLPEAPPFFGFTFLYPNPVSTKDTLTIGLDYYKHDIKYSKLNDFKVIIERITGNDTLQIIGMYNKYNLDNIPTIGVFNSEDETIQEIMSYSKITLQCVMDTNQTGTWIVKVFNNNYTTENKINLLIYKK